MLEVPKTKLDPDYHDKKVRDLLRSYLYDRHCTHAEMARLLGMTQQSFSYKLKLMSFSWQELCKTCNALDMADKDRLKIMREVK